MAPIISVTVRKTSPDSVTWAGAWDEWGDMLAWEILIVRADGREHPTYCRTEEGAHWWAKKYLAEILPVVGIAS